MNISPKQKEWRYPDYICPKCGSKNVIIDTEKRPTIGKIPFICKSCTNTWVFDCGQYDPDPWAHMEEMENQPCCYGGFHDLVYDDDEGCYYCEKCDSYVF